MKDRESKELDELMHPLSSLGLMQPHLQTDDIADRYCTNADKPHDESEDLDIYDADWYDGKKRPDKVDDTGLF